MEVQKQSLLHFIVLPRVCICRHCSKPPPTALRYHDLKSLSAQRGCAWQVLRVSKCPHGPLHRTICGTPTAWTSPTHRAFLEAEVIITWGPICHIFFLGASSRCIISPAFGAQGGGGHRVPPVDVFQPAAFLPGSWTPPSRVVKARPRSRANHPVARQDGRRDHGPLQHRRRLPRVPPQQQAQVWHSLPAAHAYQSPVLLMLPRPLFLAFAFLRPLLMNLVRTKETGTSLNLVVAICHAESLLSGRSSANPPHCRVEWKGSKHVWGGGLPGPPPSVFFSPRHLAPTMSSKPVLLVYI